MHIEQRQGSTKIAAMPAAACLHITNDASWSGLERLDEQKAAVQIVLEMEDVDGGLVIVQAPPNAFVAPPGLYMLFLLSQGVPSVAVWVRAQCLHILLDILLLLLPPP